MSSGPALPVKDLPGTAGGGAGLIPAKVDFANFSDPAFNSVAGGSS